MTSEKGCSQKTFLKACYCRNGWISSREMDQMFPKVGTNGYGDFYLDCVFCYWKVLDYRLKKKMLLEVCDYNLSKDLDVVTWWDEDRVHLCLFTWLYYSFVFTNDSFCFPLFFVSLFQPVFSAFYLTSRLRIEKTLRDRDTSLMGMFKKLLFVIENSKNPHTNVSVFKKVAVKCVEEGMFALHVAPKHNSERCRRRIFCQGKITKQEYEHFKVNDWEGLDDYGCRKF